MLRRLRNLRGSTAFGAVFAAVALGAALVVAAFLLHAARPERELRQPTAALVRATGKCAECHRRETPSIVHQFESSLHAVAGVSCLDCHRAVDEQEEMGHRGFVLTESMTAGNCAQCHANEYRQYLRSRHAAPAWAAVTGPRDFTPEQIQFAEQFHPGAVDRPANVLAQLEGVAAMTSGCEGCHDIGEPNSDGTIGTCTECHSRHTTSIEFARTPQTCGQCHMGPDHAQIEIFTESKHGVLWAALREHMDMAVAPDELRTEHMPAPTCATCHMSGLEGYAVTHDTTERLTYWLFAPVSERRPGYLRAKAQMQGICGECHSQPSIERFYADAEEVILATNDIVLASEQIMADLHEEGLLTPTPFDEPLEFTAFDLWHYYGRTAKHGAFMGGPDFVQWHGFYELTAHLAEIRDAAEELRAGGEGQPVAKPGDPGGGGGG